MGSSSSVVSAQSNIRDLHGNIGVMYNRINKKGRWLINEINTRGYSDRNAICSKILWTNYDELSGFFPITTIDNIRYKAGVAVDNPNLQQNKIQTCMAIERLYRKKINLINYILEALPKCVLMENQVYKGLEQKLSSVQTNKEAWLTIYQTLESFNKDIKNRYDLIEKQLENVRLAKTVTEIDGVVKTTTSILGSTTAICQNYESTLLDFSQKIVVSPIAVSPIAISPTVPASVIPSKPLPVESGVTEVFLK